MLTCWLHANLAPVSWRTEALVGNQANNSNRIINNQGRFFNQSTKLFRLPQAFQSTNDYFQENMFTCIETSADMLNQCLRVLEINNAALTLHWVFQIFIDSLRTYKEKLRLYFEKSQSNVQNHRYKNVFLFRFEPKSY